MLYVRFVYGNLWSPLSFVCTSSDKIETEGNREEEEVVEGSEANGSSDSQRTRPLVDVLLNNPANVEGRMRAVTLTLFDRHFSFVHKGNLN